MAFDVKVDLKLDETGKALVEETSKAIGAVFGEASKELSHLMGDHMRFWRFQNFTRIIEKVEAIKTKKGLQDEDVKRLGFGEQFLVIEKASLEENSAVQELWAGLIFNSIQPDKDTAPEKRILDILASLGPAEAGFLRVMTYTVHLESRRFDVENGLDTFQRAVTKIADAHWRHFDSETQKAALQNLIRLRCIALRPRIENLQGLLARLPREITRDQQDWCVLDERKFNSLIQQIARIISENSGLTSPNMPPEDRRTRNSLFGDNTAPLVKEFAFGLTSLGIELVTACETEIDFGRYPGELRPTPDKQQQGTTP